MHAILAHLRLGLVMLFFRRHHRGRRCCGVIVAVCCLLLFAGFSPAQCPGGRCGPRAAVPFAPPAFMPEFAPQPAALPEDRDYRVIHVFPDHTDLIVPVDAEGNAIGDPVRMRYEGNVRVGMTVTVCRAAPANFRLVTLNGVVYTRNADGSLSYCRECNDR